MAKKKTKKTAVETLTHRKAKRKNIPTVEYQDVMRREEQKPKRAAYKRRNRDRDPQLVWRGKDEQDWSDLVVPAPPLYIQEKLHPKTLIDELRRQTERAKSRQPGFTPDLFADFNGLSDPSAKTEFYRHDANWSNRMILGDSLQVMASLAEREGLRGKVQCIYIDPPYGIKFNSNFQWSTTTRDVRDGKAEHITREPEQVQAYRDTWRDGIHSYLTYLRDRLTVARDLLTESGSIFVQIGDENVHLVRCLMDEVFGAENFVSLIYFATTSGFSASEISRVGDYLVWYGKDKSKIKYRPLFQFKKGLERGDVAYRHIELSDGTRRPMAKDERDGRSPLPEGCRIFRYDNSQSQGKASEDTPFEYEGQIFRPLQNSHWKANYPEGMENLKKANRFTVVGDKLWYVRYMMDYPVQQITNSWMDTSFAGFATDKKYVVETNEKVVQRCLLMTTDPGDLVLDPTCGSGTTAYVAEQWGRRWIAIDTSRVALALARTRVMGARYPWYLLSDSPEGQQKEAEIARTAPSDTPTYGDIRQGFVYERVPHITLKSIANNAEIDVIWEKFQQSLEPLRKKLNKALKKQWQEWEIPRDADESWPSAGKKIHAQWWQQRLERQQRIDASIAAGADHDYLYDKPYEDQGVIRVAGPFTVESLSPHRVLAVDENDELVDSIGEATNREYEGRLNFVKAILANLELAGVQQAHKEDRITFTSLDQWSGKLICAEGRYIEGAGDADEGTAGSEKRAAIFIGPEFGTVSRPDLAAATREAGEAGFDVLIACAFNYDAPSSDFTKMGRMQVLKAHINADLHMARNLKGRGNLFVIFGEPDIEIIPAGGDEIQIRIKGVDVFHPQTGEVHSDSPDDIACWFIDSDYNEEAFFVRQAYFLGAKDSYKALKTSLKAEIDADTWATLHSAVSRPFPKPKSGRIAVKVINHLGDEAMKVMKIRRGKR